QLEWSPNGVETNRPKVLISNPTVPQIAYDLLERFCEIVQVENDNKEEVLSKVKGVHGIYWASHLRLDKDILDAAGDQLKTVSTMSSGYNHIDVQELKRRGIPLGNTPFVLDNAVAGIDQWKPHNRWLLGQDIAGSTVGIIGLGGIGQAIVKRLKGFNVGQFLYTGHREKDEGRN
ncbi:hypothetical protein NQ317_000372, partial [Molorchus minor]